MSGETTVKKRDSIVSMGVKVEIDNITKLYNETVAVNEAVIHIKPGEFLTLLGPSGSGKTTILKMVAGFEMPDSGSILIDNQDVSNKPPNKRDIGMVFQNYALFPHMTIFDNVAFPLKMRKAKAHEINNKVKEVLELVKLSGFEKRYPRQLSGGQQQRVALARALVFSPKLLLMDEPLGALDKKLREEMQVELRRIQKELNITTINVTHDQEEALTLSDRIAVLNKGEIQQISTPTELYENPQNKFIAEFIGESNFFNLKINKIEDQTIGAETENGLRLLLNHENRNIHRGEQIEVMVRPEKVKLLKEAEMIENSFDAIVENIVYMGSDRRCYLRFENGEGVIAKWSSIITGEIQTGEKVKVGWRSKDMIVV